MYAYQNIPECFLESKHKQQGKKNAEWDNTCLKITQQFAANFYGSYEVQLASYKACQELVNKWRTGHGQRSITLCAIFSVFAIQTDYCSAVEFYFILLRNRDSVLYYV